MLGREPGSDLIGRGGVEGRGGVGGVAVRERGGAAGNGGCVGICSMSTCEVQKMNPGSQESTAYVKYIVPLCQSIYQPTECQLDSQDGAGICRAPGFGAKLSRS